jgi:hypothetical protein
MTPFSIHSFDTTPSPHWRINAASLILAFRLRVLCECAGERGLARSFTSTLELCYVKDVHGEMEELEDYDNVTSYIVAFCAVAQGHLDVAKSYSKVPTAFASSKKTDSAPTAHASHVRVDKNEESTHDSSGIHPKESWQARRAPNVANGTTADATAGRDVNAWVETVPRR